MRIKAIILTLLSLFFLTTTADAKVLPQARKTSKTAAVKSAGIFVSPKIRADRRAITVNFGNLQNAQSVSYSLTYNTSQQQEGAMGALNLNGGSSQTQELLFGTCSKNVCRYHTGIKNAKLEISYTLKSGKKYLKRYRIKV